MKVNILPYIFLIFISFACSPKHSALTEKDILKTLDDSNEGAYRSFVMLGDVYSYLLDTRLNIYRGDKNRWAIAIERLGYSPRAGYISLEINYFGNCLINMDKYNDFLVSHYDVYPIDFESTFETINLDSLNPDADHWIVRGQKIQISHDKEEYLDAGIILEEYEPNQIEIEEAGRLAVSKYRDLFRATDEELYKSIPKDLNKILVLDEWFHKDYLLDDSPVFSEKQLKEIYKTADYKGISYEKFKELIEENKLRNDEWNNEMIDNNRPSSYETWQLIAKVIVSNDSSQYQPTLKPNTHWKYWLDSGSF